MKHRLLIKLSNNRGNTFVELALILPFLFSMALGVFDYSRAIHAKNIIVNMSREGANLKSRGALSDTDTMNAVAYTAQPLDMNTNGMIYITVVQARTHGNTDTYTILSQSQWQNRLSPPWPASRIGETSEQIRQNLNLGPLNLQPGGFINIYVVEVLYRYRGVFYTLVGLDKQLYSRTVFQ